MQSRSDFPGDEGPVPIEKSAVILLGAHEFPNIKSLTPIPQLVWASKAFKTYLLSHREILGIDCEDFVLDLFDSNEHSGMQLERISGFLERFVNATPKCKRNVFVHYAGHGLLLGERRAVALAVRAAKDKSHSALNVSNLAEVLADSGRFSRKLIFFDCCFSAAAAALMLADEAGLTHYVGTQTKESFREKGRGTSGLRLSRGSALMCAVGKDDLASGEIYNGATLFTGALLEALQQPDPTNPRITMQDLRERTAACLEEAGKVQYPQLFSLDQAEGDVAHHLHVFPTGPISKGAGSTKRGGTLPSSSSQYSQRIKRLSLVLFKKDRINGVFWTAVFVTLFTISLASVSRSTETVPRTVDEYISAIRSERNAQKRQELRERARGLLSGDLDFGEIGYSLSFPNLVSRRTSFVKYSPTDNVLTVRLDEQFPIGLAGAGDVNAVHGVKSVVDIDLSRLESVRQVGGWKIYLSCETSRDCVHFHEYAGWCHYQDKLERGGCEVGSVVLGAVGEIYLKRLKKFAAAVEKIVFEIDGGAQK